MIMQMQQRLGVGVVGASGFTGAELLRLLAGHPALELRVATADSLAGTRLGDRYPTLAAAYPALGFESLDLDRLDGLDLVVLGLPHEASMELAPQLLDRVGCVVDLSAAFRLEDPSAYSEYYGFEHTRPDLLAEAVFGLPELHRTELAGARLVATPGCHVTTAVLALRPLVAAGLVDTVGLVVDTMTGITGAGRTPTDTNVFTNIDANAVAYGLLRHRHTPEMEQEIGGSVLFTPHLVPMSRGLLATCHARPTGSCSTDALLDALRDAYTGEPFVVVTDSPPATKSLLGSNTVHVSARYDARTDAVIAMSALDNLTKGASGGALQAANVALGLEETAGLPIVGLGP
jgi:N-acetyl-gamma-glutamyl-phosphate reductase